MPTTETELQQQKSVVDPSLPTAISQPSLMVVDPVGLEQTSEFQSWLKERAKEVLNYLKLSFNKEVAVEKLVFHPIHLGYPDPNGQLRTHARIWGYNYKLDGENVINPETQQPMSYVVWQKLDPPVMPIEVADPPLESDQDTPPEEFEPDTEPAAAVA